MEFKIKSLEERINGLENLLKDAMYSLQLQQRELMSLNEIVRSSSPGDKALDQKVAHINSRMLELESKHNLSFQLLHA